MFRKVLIANRGEIACRIASTLHEMGVRSAAVYAEADRGAMHTRMADEAYALGLEPAAAGAAGGAPRGAYLDVEALIEVAKKCGAEAVHPGYGFLAENAAFAEAVEQAGLTFIGPTPEQIRVMGDKRAARHLAVKAGVPVVPGAEGADVAALARAAGAMGYPVMVKAALGGGGKGMRAVNAPAALAEAVESARRVAGSAFGDDTVYLEKRVDRARHVEVQVLGDGRGTAIHLFERECSLQRRHQKVIEESPSPAVDDALRERLAAAAVALACAVRYRGAGTIEFLLDPSGAFHFLEMNTRLQVEHPVTELVTGVDLVRAQILVAAEGRLPCAQAQVVRRGHAVEARVYAEDAARDFLPQAGEIVRLRWPHGAFVRVDRGVEAGDRVTVHFDPMLAKIVTFAPDRALALQRLAGALDDARVHGVVTNLPFLRALVRSPAVQAAAFDTEWIEREFLTEFAALATAPAPELALAAAALAELLGLARAERPANGATATADHAPAPDPFASLGRWRHPGLE
jgi:acetyl/propionyl-CoA carboxylase alpha subunit